MGYIKQAWTLGSYISTIYEIIPDAFIDCGCSYIKQITKNFFFHWLADIYKWAYDLINLAILCSLLYDR